MKYEIFIFLKVQIFLTGTQAPFLYSDYIYFVKKKKKDICLIVVWLVSFFSYEDFVLYSMEANVNGAHAPHPMLLSPEPEGIQTAYFYTYWYPGEKGKEEFIKPGPKKDVTFSVLPRAESWLK